MRSVRMADSTTASTCARGCSRSRRTSRSTRFGVRIRHDRARRDRRRRRPAPAYAELAELTDGLGPKERAAVVLRYGYDLSYDQIASVLELDARRRPPGGVHGRPPHPKEDHLMTVSPDLDRRFRDAAAALGLIDVGYDVVDSPIGELLVAASDRGARHDLVRPGSPTRTSSASRASPGRASFARRAASTAPAASSTSTSRAGAARSTSRSTCARCRPSPSRCSASSRASRTARRRPTARSRERVGHPRAARAVGTVMNRNRIPIVLPCHRVVGSTGDLTGYAGGLDRKRTLLELEGAR